MSVCPNQKGRSAIAWALVAALAATTWSEGALAEDGSPPGKETSSGNDGVLGPIRLGAFAGVGLPRPLSIEGILKVDDVIAFGLEYSALPKTSLDGVDLRFDAIDADVRVFPFRGPFFIGLAGGRQHVSASGTLTLPSGLGSYAEEVTADTWYVNPRIGFLWTWSWGLTLGADIGAQIPVAASFTSTLPTALSVSQTATDVAHVFGKDVLPTVNVLRVGFLL